MREGQALPRGRFRKDFPGKTKKTAARPSQPVKKVVFDRLPEGKGAAKTSKPDPSAYRWYGRVRFVQ